jgi:hypothetical protein
MIDMFAPVSFVMEDASAVRAFKTCFAKGIDVVAGAHMAREALIPVAFFAADGTNYNHLLAAWNCVRLNCLSALFLVLCAWRSGRRLVLVVHDFPPCLSALG